MSAQEPKISGTGQRLVLAAPFLWLMLFFLLPFALVAKVSLSQSVLGQPPYQPVFDWHGVSDFLDKLKQLSWDS
ncbi:MAG TPA: putrescine/spermidine ABC transporter permease, partial [Methylovirgula sp.]